ncbi:MAG TPA: alpha-2-macroglobulin family protein, partial [Bacteroidales bacterium]|nr:alpha-2-macroglobulin family protein [Bacteroidales bacterium]
RYPSDLTSALQGKVSGVSITGETGGAVNIKIRGASTERFDKQPLYVIDGQIYAGDINDLDPNLISNIQILKDAKATALYGAQGANGVVLIVTGGAFKPAGALAEAEYDDAFYEASGTSHSLRTDFSDFAFWQPELLTDENGKARFEVTFPDDVTSWRTFYYVMDGKKKSGKKEQLIRSYKPLMAKLAAPRFLVEGDTLFALGKILNYTPDSATIVTTFELDQKKLFGRNRVCGKSIIDTLIIPASGDSMRMKYSIQRNDGYFDGEQRILPVYPVGMEETEGEFMVLNGDTSVSVIPDPLMDELTIHARADIMEVIEDELYNLIHYVYTCNEQLASKLKALLMEENIRKATDEKFKHEQEIKKIIRLLQKNENDKGLWGWWRDSEKPQLWISLHVLEALSTASEMGYQSDMDTTEITGLLIWQLDSEASVNTKLRIMNLLQLLNVRINYNLYITDIEGKNTLKFNQYINLTRLKQLCGLRTTPIPERYRNETMFGNVYYDDSATNSLFDNTIQNTLIAYRVLRHDSSTDHEAELQKMRNYFFEVRNQNGWQNTYESSCILETILPDVLDQKSYPEKPALVFRGPFARTVTDFPFDTTLSSTSRVEVIKKGDYPVYFTSYQHRWNPSPDEKKSDFEISTRFSTSDSSGQLVAGKEVKLIVDLHVKKDADYVMINIPIPAGCSHSAKKKYFLNEVHREYFRDRTSIFCEQLRKGDYRFEIELMPRFSGTYKLNPAKVELMYFPTFNANNKSKRVVIE